MNYDLGFALKTVAGLHFKKTVSILFSLEAIYKVLVATIQQPNHPLSFVTTSFQSPVKPEILPI